MALVDTLKTARDNFASQLVDLSENPKLTYSIDGQSISWAEYFKMLTEQIKMLQEQIIALEPYSYRSIVR